MARWWRYGCGVVAAAKGESGRVGAEMEEDAEATLGRPLSPPTGRRGGRRGSRMPATWRPRSRFDRP